MKNVEVMAVIEQLLGDSKSDPLRMMKAAARGVFRPLEPADFKDVFLAISREQGEYLVELITLNNLRNIVEFGTSFGISTLFLALGAIETKGRIITTELVESKAVKADSHFKLAGVSDIIDLRVGNAMEVLKGHREPIDLLLLDGWKDLYLPLFRMLEPCFHSHTMIYADNADMHDSQTFLQAIEGDEKYQVEYIHGGKAAMIKLKVAK